MNDTAWVEKERLRQPPKSPQKIKRDAARVKRFTTQYGPMLRALVGIAPEWYVPELAVRSGLTSKEARYQLLRLYELEMVNRRHCPNNGRFLYRKVD